MYHRQTLFVVFIILTAPNVSALQDTLRLDTVEIMAFPIEKYATGAVLQQLDLSKPGFLGDVLAEQSSIYFRTYGNDQLSTISFRGTSPSHTNLLWHGLPVNSVTLGQTDFSLWPVWLMSSLAVQAGSGGGHFGSGSIGGSVFIDDFGELEKQAPGLSVVAGVGSFGALKWGLRGTYGIGRWKGETGYFQRTIENDFQYEVPGTGTSQKQVNAAVQALGLKQSLQYSGELHRLSLSALYLSNDREIQPPVTNLEADDELLTRSFRMAGESFLSVGSIVVTSTVGINVEDYIFNRTDTTRSSQWTWSERVQVPLSRKLDVQGGMLLSGATAFSGNYMSRSWQEQFDVFGIMTYTPVVWMKLTASMRQSFYDGARAPLMPSVGGSFTLRDDIHLTSRLGRGYRYPTLNDRFWIPGGNPDLKPELSTDTEVAINYSRKGDRSAFESSLSGYRIWSDDWIVWLPDGSGVWSPENLRRVWVTGAEVRSSYRYEWQDHALLTRVNFAFNRSQNRSGPAEVQGNQLAYVPLFTGNLLMRFDLKNWTGSIRQEYTGKRYTTLDNLETQSVDGFYLLHLSVKRHFRMEGSWSVIAEGRINNLANSYYENLNNRAMPGRNYQLQIQINY